MTERAEYLGDGVYADFDGFQVWIWTSDGLAPSERIALEPAVLKALDGFYRRRSEAIRPGLTRDEQRAQALRCDCRGADDLCACQNVPDGETRRVRADRSASADG